MNTWLVTDTHLGHDMLVTRGYRPATFEDQLLANLRVIPEGDILIHLGDVCFGNEQYNHHRLLDNVAAKTKVLVRGNHDKKSDTWYHAHGWDMVVKEMWIERFGYDIVFTHEPADLKLRYGGWETLRNIHGHTHGGAALGDGHRMPDVAHYYDYRYHVELALELTDYRPVKLTDKFVIGKGDNSGDVDSRRAV